MKKFNDEFSNIKRPFPSRGSDKNNKRPVLLSKAQQNKIRQMQEDAEKLKKIKNDLDGEIKKLDDKHTNLCYELPGMHRMGWGSDQLE